MILRHDDLIRVVSHWIRALVAPQRGLTPWELHPAPMIGSSTLDRHGLALDSLERVMVATAVNRQFHLFESGLEDWLLARHSLSEWAQTILDSRRMADAHLSFETGGSTSEPKRIEHSVRMMDREIDSLLALLDHVERIVSFVPAHHMYGFNWTVALASKLGVPVEDRAFRLSNVSHLRPSDLAIGVPNTWKWVAQDNQRFPPKVTVVSSTAPLHGEVSATLRTLGAARVLEIYGSTETGAVAWRDHPHDPFRLLSQWTRSSDTHLTHDFGMTLALMDVVTWESSKFLRVKRRLDDMVQIGGINVSPQHVQTCLAELPGVAECAVRSYSVEGDVRLKAFVVPREGVQASQEWLQSLRKDLMSQLRPAEIPSMWRYGLILPRSPMGKPADWDVSSAPELASL